jgi:hypothetical protein
MVVETNGDETYNKVVKYLSDELTNNSAGALVEKSEDILEKVKTDYVEAEGVLEKGKNYPKVSEFSDESNLSGKNYGRALSALAEMPFTDFDTRRDENPPKTYDMASADPERLCEVLEIITEIPDEELDWEP